MQDRDCITLQDVLLKIVHIEQIVSIHSISKVLFCIEMSFLPKTVASPPSVILHFILDVVLDVVFSQPS